MDHQQQQTQQTENLIKEMLEFLDTSSEEEDQPEKLTANGNLAETPVPNNKTNGEVLMKALTEGKQNQKSSSTKDMEKLYPIWNTKEIVSNNKKAFNYQQSPAALADPIWRQSSLSLLDKSEEPAEGEVLTPTTDINDWHTKLEANYRRSSNNVYMQEVHKAIYGDTTNHPASDSAGYYQAAQNYAIYGENFLDFPENLQSVLNDKSTCSKDNTNASAKGLYPIPQVQGAVTANDGGVGVNNFVTPNISTSNTVGTPSSSATVVGSTPAYYQMFNGMQPQSRQTVGSAQAYGIFLGNNVTYHAAAPTAPPVVYNQHTTATTNFISNSLANIALPASPAILYSNPVLTTTTQQCLNTFFKETQYLCSGTPAAGNSAQGTGIYERILYAQMLQQQMYQTQQNAAIASMFQHKQRVTAAAAAASSASARQTPTGVNANGVSNGNTTVSPPATLAATICNTIAAKVSSRPPAKVCKNSNKSTSASNNSPLEQQNLKVSPKNTIDVSNDLND